MHMAMKSHRKIYKNLCGLLAALLVFGCFSVSSLTVKADNGSVIKIGDKLILSAETPYYFNGDAGTIGTVSAEDPNGTANAVWSAATGTLTISGLNLVLTSDDPMATAISCNTSSEELDQITLVVVAGSYNTIDNQSAAFGNGLAYGISSMSDLVLTGGGSLEIYSRNDCIHSDASISILDGTTVALQSNSHALATANDGFVSISASTVSGNTGRDTIMCDGLFVITSHSVVDLYSESGVCVSTDIASISSSECTLTSYTSAISEDAKVLNTGSTIKNGDGKLIYQESTANASTTVDDEADSDSNNETVSESSAASADKTNNTTKKSAKSKSSSDTEKNLDESQTSVDGDDAEADGDTENKKLANLKKGSITNDSAKMIMLFFFIVTGLVLMLIALAYGIRRGNKKYK